MDYVYNFNDFINEKKKENWIQKTGLKKGALKKALGYEDDETIAKGIIKQIIDKEIGSEVEVKGKKVKITDKLKKEAELAQTFSELKKK